MRMKKISLGLAVVASLVNWHQSVQAQVVPGTGQQIVEVGDDFEDANWSFTYNLPKASSNIDKVDRQPSGFSNNGAWMESLFRGTPDFVKRVETPEGGIPGSKGAMALQTLYSGVPGQLSHKFQQDDLIANVQQRLGYMLPASWTPSYVCRVYVPPFEEWEQRVGSSFGFRADCHTMIDKPTKVAKLFGTRGTSKEMEQYWPGFFFQFNGKSHPQYPDRNTATILIRSGERGQDIPGPAILKEGWWTLGMTITPDGRVHYYAHEGVENLTAKDLLYSNYPYGYRCLQTSTFFFNVVNQDDGRTWSTRWIVDDPKVYVATGAYVPRKAPQTAQVPVTPVSQSVPANAATPTPIQPSLVPVPVPANQVISPTPISPSAPAPTLQNEPALETVTPRLEPVPDLQPIPANGSSSRAKQSLVPAKPVLSQDSESKAPAKTPETKTAAATTSEPTPEPTPEVTSTEPIQPVSTSEPALQPSLTVPTTP